MSQSMWALTFDSSREDWSGSRGLVKERVPRPRLDDPAHRDGTSLIVKVRYAGFCGSDRGIWTRKAFGDMILDSLKEEEKTKRIVGHELLGEIVEIGDRVAAKYGYAVSLEISKDSRFIELHTKVKQLQAKHAALDPNKSREEDDVDAPKPTLTKTQPRSTGSKSAIRKTKTQPRSTGSKSAIRRTKKLTLTQTQPRSTGSDLTKWANSLWNTIRVAGFSRGRRGPRNDQRQHRTPQVNMDGLQKILSEHHIIESHVDEGRTLELRDKLHKVTRDEQEADAVFKTYMRKYGIENGTIEGNTLHLGNRTYSR